MAGSAAVMVMCQELSESVFFLRGALPLAWHGSAAEAFDEQLENVIVELARATGELRRAAGLIRVHEENMRVLSQAMGAGG